MINVRLVTVNYDARKACQYAKSSETPIQFEGQQKQHIASYSQESRLLIQDERVAEIAEFLLTLQGPITITVPSIEFGNKLSSLIKRSVFVRSSQDRAKLIINHTLDSGNALIILSSTMRNEFCLTRSKCLQYAFVDCGKLIADLCDPIRSMLLRFELDVQVYDIHSNVGYSAAHVARRTLYYKSHGMLVN